MKQCRFRRIEIFGFALINHASAERNDPAARVANRKHDAIAKAVIVHFTVARRAAFAFDDKSRIVQCLTPGIIAAEVFQNVVPGIFRIAD